MTEINGPPLSTPEKTSPKAYDDMPFTLRPGRPISRSSSNSEHHWEAPVAGVDLNERNKRVVGDPMQRVLELCGVHKPVSFAETRRLLREKDGPEGQKATEELVSHNLQLVLYFAKAYRRVGLEVGLQVEDLFQEGVVGLQRAANRGDVEKAKNSNSFSTYAADSINGVIKRAIEKEAGELGLSSVQYRKLFAIATAEAELMQRLQRNPTNAEIANHWGDDSLSLEDVKKYRDYDGAPWSLDRQLEEHEGDLDAEPVFSPPERSMEAQAAEDVAFIAKLLRAELSDNQYNIASQYFGLEGESKSAAAIAEDEGISITRVYNIIDDVRNKMKAKYPSPEGLENAHLLEERKLYKEAERSYTALVERFIGEEDVDIDRLPSRREYFASQGLSSRIIEEGDIMYQASSEQIVRDYNGRIEKEIQALINELWPVKRNEGRVYREHKSVNKSDFIDTMSGSKANYSQAFMQWVMTAMINHRYIVDLGDRVALVNQEVDKVK